jgi:uncharacterized repeat protein (TIGR03803 family)
MRSKNSSIRLFATLMVLTLTVIACGKGAGAQQVRVLYNFNAFLGNHTVYGGVIFDKAGNMYGTTSQGGAFNLGTAWELTPNGAGGFTETVLHNFNNDGIDGWSPSTSLILDASGNLYGVAPYGGATDAGVVFELSPAGGGQWTETIVHTFNNTVDGGGPSSALIMDAQGNLYGTTAYGPNCGLGCGTIFELSKQSGGGWSLNILHAFSNNGPDGSYPRGVIFDAKGNLFGTTLEGGTYNAGVVFELSPQGGGLWNETVLHNFQNNGIDGIYPDGGVILDAKGNLYGTTHEGGNVSIGYGTVYELAPSAAGSWTETILFNCAGGVGGTANPIASLIFDAKGNLYGTTVQGGVGSGNVFALRPTALGWVEKTVHSFQNNRKDGMAPYDALIVGPSGNLYGTTSSGGLKMGGTVFEIIP